MPRPTAPRRGSPLDRSGACLRAPLIAVATVLLGSSPAMAGTDPSTQPGTGLAVCEVSGFASVGEDRADLVSAHALWYPAGTFRGPRLELFLFSFALTLDERALLVEHRQPAVVGNRPPRRHVHLEMNFDRDAPRWGPGAANGQALYLWNFEVSPRSLGWTGMAPALRSLAGDLDAGGPIELRLEHHESQDPEVRIDATLRCPVQVDPPPAPKPDATP